MVLPPSFGSPAQWHAVSLQQVSDVDTMRGVACLAGWVPVTRASQQLKLTGEVRLDAGQAAWSCYKLSICC